MHEAILRLEVENPALVAKSIKPDLKSSKVKIDVRAGKKTITIKIKTQKISYLKGVVTTYISLVKVLDEASKVI